MELIGRYFDYRHYLKDELSERTHANPQYSLRAFARDLGLSPQVLSSVMNGKKNISSEVAVEVARKLRLSESETSYFNDIVEMSQVRNDNLRAVIRYRLTRYEENDSYRSLSQDVFRIISDWHHYAILQLTETSGFKYDIRWLAARLGISEPEVRAAIGRLLELELVEEANGTLRKSEVNLASTHDVPSAAVRKFTQQMLEKAQSALELQTIDERDFGTMTMAIDISKIPEAKKRIKKFRRELADLLETGDRAEVYTFATQLFRLTKPIAAVRTKK